MDSILLNETLDKIKNTTDIQEKSNLIKSICENLSKLNSDTQIELTITELAKKTKIAKAIWFKNLNETIALLNPKQNKEEDYNSDITNSTVEIVEKFIRNNYKLRYNEVSNQLESKRLDVHPWDTLNENEIYRNLQKRHIKFCLNDLKSLLRSDFVEKFNPIKDYFESLPKWDQQTDYIQQLCDYITVRETDKERFLTQFKKHLVRSIAGSFHVDFNKQAFILVHDQQNSGKTTFIRWLCPPILQDYYTENITTDKDGLHALTQNFIINLDELSTLDKHEINALKSIMSKDKIKIRLPYAANTVVLQRIGNFWGSTNDKRFLTDATGNVRWICFDIISINWDYFKDIDINNVWSQAYYYFNSGFQYKLTRKEIEENEFENEHFFVSTPEMDLISIYYKPANPFTDNSIFVTTTEINQYLTLKTDKTQRLTNKAIGAALKKLGFIQTSKYDQDRKFSIKGYYIQSMDNAEVEKNKKELSEDTSDVTVTTTIDNVEVLIHALPF